MKDLSTIEAVEQNTFECMDWMENKIKDAVETLIKQNKENFKYIATEYGKGYAEGIHDGLLDLLGMLEIEIDEEYFNN